MLRIVKNGFVAAVWGQNYWQIEGGILIRAESFSLNGGERHGSCLPRRLQRGLKEGEARTGGKEEGQL